MTGEAVLRVNQLDACELDDSISDILQHQFLEVFRPFQSLLIHQFGPELKAFVRFLIWRFSISSNGRSTFGQSMLSLAYYSDGSGNLSAVHKSGLFVSIVMMEWLQERSEWLISRFPHLSSLQRVLDYSTAAVKTSLLFNFVLFLISGRYPTLKERLLGLRMVPTSPHFIQQVSHSYLTREILWHGFSEFVFFILPHFNLFSLWNWVRRVSYLKTALDNRLCAFCEGLPTLPHLSSCGHMYCYYCLKANLQADSQYPCCVCNQVVHSCTPAAEALS